jgi:hypothetical protein
MARMGSRHLYATAFAGVLAACAFASGAGAASVSIESENSTTLPGTAFVTAPVSTNGSFTLSQTGSSANQYLSPFGNTTSAFSVISPGNLAFAPGSSATFNIAAGSAGFSFLWGSPDLFNSVQFWTGANGTGTKVGSAFTGASLAKATLGSGFDFVTFLLDGVGSVVFTDPTGQAAFEFADVAATPLPAALPLVAGGLGFVAWLTRKRKQRAGIVDAAIA